MSQQTQHSSAHLLQQISKQRGAGSPFTSHTGVPARARTDEKPTPSEKRVLRKPNPTKPAAASKQANGPIVEDDCSNEPFISARAPKDGLPRYCAQIRRKTEDGPINVSKTFLSLEDAKKWRDDTLARIQLGLLAPRNEDSPKSSLRVCDLIQKRKDKGRRVGKSAMQNLDFLIAHKRCKVAASTIDLKWFQDVADDLLKLEMLPQTAATYMTMLASSLKWAAERDEDVPYHIFASTKAKRPRGS